MPGMGRGTSRRLVEEKSATVVQYVQHHIVEIMENIGCFDPQGADSFGFQLRVSALVLRDLADVVMAAAIHFDRWPGGSATEVEHIRSGRVMAAEFQVPWSRGYTSP